MKRLFLITIVLVASYACEKKVDKTEHIPKAEMVDDADGPAGSIENGER